MSAKYDMIGGILIIVSIAMGISEVLIKGYQNVVFLDLLPYAMWIVIGLVIAYTSECKYEK